MATDTNEMTITSDEQLLAAERAAADYRTKRAAEMAAERDKRMEPLRAIVNAAAFDQMIADLLAIQRSGALIDEGSIDAHLRAALQVLPNLKVSVA